MPSGSITAAERHIRACDIRDKLDSGMSPNQIANELGMSLTAVRRSMKYLEEMEICTLTPEMIAEKRAEIDAELIEAQEEAKEMYFTLKNGVPKINIEGKTIKDENGNIVLFPNLDLAKQYHTRWTSVLKQRQEMFGIAKVEMSETINAQINTQNNTIKKAIFTKADIEEARKKIIDEV